MNNMTHDLQPAQPMVMDTQTAAPERRFELFRQQAASYKDPWTTYLHRTPRELFHARTVVIEGRETFTGHRTSTPIRRTITGAESGRGDTPGLWLCGCRTGRARVEARGQTWALAPHSLVAALTDEPSTLHYDTPHQAAFIDVPAERLSIPLHVLRQLTFTALAESGPPCSFFFFAAVASTLTAGRCDARGIDAYLAGLVDLMLRTALGLDPDHADTCAARRHQVERYVTDHLTSPNLGIYEIAAALRISPRRLYQLFEDRDETLSELIQRLRVEHAKDLLAAAPGERITLDDLARRCGFGSTRTLTRAFQRTTGSTPARYARDHHC